MMMDRGITPTDLFHGENSVPNRLRKLKYYLANNRNNDFVDNEGNINNEFIKFIDANIPTEVDGFTFDGGIITQTMFSQDGDTRSTIIKDWEAMLESDNESIKKLAEDLIYFSFLTHADGNGLNQFFDMVPYKWRKESGYADGLREIL